MFFKFESFFIHSFLLKDRVLEDEMIFMSSLCYELLNTKRRK